MSECGSASKRHNPVESIRRKIKTIEMRDQESNPYLQIPKFQSRNFDSPQSSTKKNLEEVLKNRAMKNTSKDLVSFSSPGISAVQSPNPQQVATCESPLSTIYCTNLPSKEQSKKVWSACGSQSCSTPLVGPRDTPFKFQPLLPDYKSVILEDRIVPSIPGFYYDRKSDNFTLKSPVVKRLSLSESAGFRRVVENRPEPSCDVSLICEEDLLDSIFHACDTEHRGKVAVSKIVDYLRHTTSRGSEDSGLSELCHMLDPERRDISMDLDTYHAIMKEWVDDCRNNGPENKTKESVLAAEESMIKLRESLIGVRRVSGTAMNVTCGSLEAFGGDISRGDLDTSDLIVCIADLQYNNQKLQEQQSKLKAAIEAQEESNQRLLEENEDLRNQWRSAQQSIIKVRTLKGEVEDLKLNVAALEEAKTQLVAQNKQTEKENLSLIHKITSLQEENLRSVREVEEVRKALSQVTDKAADLQVQLADFESALRKKDAALLVKEVYIEEMKTTLREYSSVIENLRIEKSKLENNLQQMEQELLSNGINSPITYKLSRVINGGLNSLHTELEYAQHSLEVSMADWMGSASRTSSLDVTLDREVLMLLQGPGHEQMAAEFRTVLQALQEDACTMADRVLLPLQRLIESEIDLKDLSGKMLEVIQKDLKERRKNWEQKLKQLQKSNEELDKEVTKLSGNLRRMKTEQLHLRKELTARRSERVSLWTRPVFPRLWVLLSLWTRPVFPRFWVLLSLWTCPVFPRFWVLLSLWTRPVFPRFWVLLSLWTRPVFPRFGSCCLSGLVLCFLGSGSCCLSGLVLCFLGSGSCCLSGLVLCFLVSGLVVSLDSSCVSSVLGLVVSLDSSCVSSVLGLVVSLDLSCVSSVLGLVVSLDSSCVSSVLGLVVSLDSSCVSSVLGLVVSLDSSCVSSVLGLVVSLDSSCVSSVLGLVVSLDSSCVSSVLGLVVSLDSSCVSSVLGLVVSLDLSCVSSVLGLVVSLDSSCVSSVLGLVVSLDSSCVSSVLGLVVSLDSSCVSSVLGLVVSLDSSCVSSVLGLVVSLDSSCVSSVLGLVVSLDSSCVSSVLVLVVSLDSSCVSSVLGLVVSLDSSCVSSVLGLVVSLDLSCVSSVLGLVVSLDLSSVARDDSFYLLHDLEAARHRQEEAEGREAAVLTQLHDSASRQEDLTKQIDDLETSLHAVRSKGEELQQELEEAQRLQRELQAAVQELTSDCRNREQKATEQEETINLLQSRLLDHQTSHVCGEFGVQESSGGSCGRLQTNPRLGYTPLLDALSLERGWGAPNNHPANYWKPEPGPEDENPREVTASPEASPILQRPKYTAAGTQTDEENPTRAEMEKPVTKVVRAEERPEPANAASISVISQTSGDSAPSLLDNTLTPAEPSAALVTIREKAPGMESKDVEKEKVSQRSEDSGLAAHGALTVQQKSGDPSKDGGSKSSPVKPESEKRPPPEKGSPAPSLVKISQCVEENHCSNNEKEMEAEFLRLSLGFKCDIFTLDKRLRLEERSRDLAEENLKKELASCKKLLEALTPLCEDDNQTYEIVQKLQNSLQFLTQHTARVASRSEMLGAIHQESRVSKAVEVMIQHVENLKRMYAKEHAELEELRQAMHQSDRSSGSTDREDSLKLASSIVSKVSPARRVSMPAYPRGIGTGSPMDLFGGDKVDGKLQHRRSNSWKLVGSRQNDNRPTLQRFVDNYTRPEPSEENAIKEDEPSTDVTEDVKEERVRKYSYIQKSLPPPKPESAYRKVVSWTWDLKRSLPPLNRPLLVMVGAAVLLVTLLSFLMGLSFHKPVDGAPVETGVSWTSVQQLLWPFMGLRHNAPPPV
ncbi:inositol 1,4,5-triphosphate receptor associated 2 [Leptodactylus fuscus]